MTILFTVNCKRTNLFFVKRDLEPPFTRFYHHHICKALRTGLDKRYINDNNNNNNNNYYYYYYYLNKIITDFVTYGDLEALLGPITQSSRRLCYSLTKSVCLGGYKLDPDVKEVYE